MYQTLFTHNTNHQIFIDALKIRQKVFVEEQGVPLSLEIDGYDQTMTHVVLYHHEKPIGVSRLKQTANNGLKIQRVAIISDYRGNGLGQYLMEEIHRYGDENGLNPFYLSAQDAVIPFYQSLGYQIFHSKGYYNAGIPHHDMVKYR